MKRKIAVDIDDTISSTKLCMVREAIARWGSPEMLTAEKIIDKYRYTSRIPYWRTGEVREFFNHLNNDSDYQRSLPTIDGARDYLSAVNDVIPVGAYITMRPSSIHEATVDWLMNNGFPCARVIARPQNVPSIDAPKWKGEEIRSGGYSGMIDDYEGIVKHLGGYDGTMFLFGNHKKPRTKVKVVPCKDWQEVYSAVVKNF